MDSPRQTATASMPEYTPLDELVIDEVDEGNKLKSFFDLYFWFSGQLIQLYISIAESLGIREPPLERDKKRVRWTCICGCRLYDDFFELVPGAVEVLQQHLDNSDAGFAQSKDLGINSVRRRQAISIYHKLRNRDLKRLVKYRTQADTLWLLPFLCEIGRQWGQITISAFIVYDGTNSPDTELFLHLKKRYSKAKGIFRRFLSPWTVNAIQGLFRKHDIQTVPRLGPNYLMHLWQNPHHTDWHTYQKNKSVLDRAGWLMRKLLDLARKDTRHAGKILEDADDPMKDNHSLQDGTEQYLFRGSYVFHTIPKSHSVEPDPDATRDGFLRLTEGFGIRQFLVQVAVLCFIVYGLVLGVQFRYVLIAGLQDLELHLRLVEISGWITGLLLLIITLLSRCIMRTWICLAFLAEVLVKLSGD